jgi:putative ABC transport system substrate-binding protein
MRSLLGLAMIIGLAFGCTSPAVPISRPHPSSSPARSQHTPPRVGYLAFGSPVSAMLDLTGAFQQGLADMGYVDRQNVQLEIRYAEGNTDRLDALITELLAVPVDILVVADAITIPLARRATSSVPIVMAVSGDPVNEGLVASLGHPGGNITGLSNMSSTLSAKRVELLQASVPDLSQLAVLVNINNPTGQIQLQETLRGAQSLGIQAHAFPAQTPDDISRAFETMRANGTDGLIALPDAVTSRERVRIARSALEAGIPTIFGIREAVEAGALLAYGPDRKAMFQRTAVYVDKIIRGADPATLPIEQPTRFELVLNLATAETLGLTVPDRLLLDAAEIIR